jgi:prephenate dehydrogenase
MSRSVIVLGAGMVGVSIALHLQRRGWRRRTLTTWCNSTSSTPNLHPVRKAAPD